MKKVDGITVKKEGTVELVETSDGIGSWIIKGLIVEIKHQSLKEGGLGAVHKDVSYTIQFPDISVSQLAKLAGSDLRIAFAGELRKTNDEFVHGLIGRTLTLAELEAEISLEKSMSGDEGEIEAQIAMLKARQAAILRRKEGKGK